MVKRIIFAFIIFAAASGAAFAGSWTAGFTLQAANAQTAGTNPTLQLKQTQPNSSRAATPFPLVVANVINVALGFIGTIVTLLIIYAGYLWWSAGGNDEQVSKAKKILRNSIIGLLIIFSSRALVTFTVNSIFVPGETPGAAQQFTNQTTGSGSSGFLNGVKNFFTTF